MNEFEIITDGWQTVNNVDDPAIRATFASLQIRANGQSVTHVEEKRTQSTAHHILVPLYPLAEWIVAHWWFLMEENFGLNRKDYWERHSLARGREGFAFPDLRIVPEGAVCRIEWHPWQTRHMTVNFLSQGEVHVATDALRQTLRDLIEKVIGRLHACGIDGSWLEKEWQVIEQTDSDELAFCRAAAWVGWDPYELTKGQASALIKAHDALPEAVREEALRAAAPESLEATAAWVATGVQRLPGAKLNGVLGKFKKNIPPGSLQHLPWDEGYRLASELRKALKVPTKAPVQLEMLTGVAGTNIMRASSQVKGLDGVSGVTKEAHLTCYTASKLPHNQRFTFARGLLEWVYGEPKGPVVLTGAKTQRQQRNRAFAAELLAPAKLIQKRLIGSEVGPTQMQDIGDEFEVSAWVIQHQIQNHSLATVVD
jgi:hypothetical protein